MLGQEPENYPDNPSENLEIARESMTLNRPSDDGQTGTGVIHTHAGPKVITYLDIEGMAMFEGDISLGPVTKVADEYVRMQELAAQDIAYSVVIQNRQFRWTDNTVPFEIDPALPEKEKVTEAIAYCEASTTIIFVPHTTEENYVYFSDQGGCWSRVGMQGKKQVISVGTKCTTGNVIHEIGHAIGLWHEQSREDRDSFINIRWENIQPLMISQFAQRINDGDDVGPYDYNSIMHYPRNAFSKNNQATIEPIDARATIGQRGGFSQGDIEAITTLYPSNKTLQEIKDQITEIESSIEAGRQAIAELEEKKKELEAKYEEAGGLLQTPSLNRSKLDR